MYKRLIPLKVYAEPLIFFNARDFFRAIPFSFRQQCLTLKPTKNLNANNNLKIYWRYESIPN